jgi:hypothetical protein
MIDMYEDTGFRKMVFLRFNPDSYQAEDTRHPSPFSFTEAGTLSVDQKEFDHRMQLLNERIQVWKEKEPEEQWTVEYLFYNVGGGHFEHFVNPVPPLPGARNLHTPVETFCLHMPTLFLFS